MDREVNYFTGGEALRLAVVGVRGVVISVTEAGNVQLIARESRTDTLQFGVLFSGFESSIEGGVDFASSREHESQLDGVALRATVSRRGEVLDVVPQTTMPAAFWGALHAGAQEQLKSLLQNFFVYMAATWVEQGDTWTSTGPQVDGTTEYTLDDVTKKDGKKVAKILGKGRGKVNVESPLGPVTGDVHGKSEWLVTVADGLVLEMNSSNVFTGKVGSDKIMRTESFELFRKR